MGFTLIWVIGVKIVPRRRLVHIDIKEEVQGFVWADVVIWQMPGWWMGAPWTVKYMDDVFAESRHALCQRWPHAFRCR